ncbi:T9SS type A sorting domain-containing protein [Flammeovirga aprica]|uniref:T9SS type A sorting domain-containing protein n=1 Tax=Flammeovirga aprica JL-4 TaxID=694437 RepID=A0A7X9RUU2_9BACT|nr:T9SS type A sorting domain-containing protein [Flammeovirga aprica]NME69039.1 T9SS type A sorting domain-containing protein [Flammeovirga aprica JL-4]
MKLITLGVMLFAFSLSVNAQDRIQFTSSVSSNNTNDTEITYDNDNRVTRIIYNQNGSELYRVNYTYNGDQITRSYVYKSTPSSNTTQTLTGILDDGSLIYKLLDRIEALEQKVESLSDNNGGITSTTSNTHKIALFPNPTASTFTIPNGFRFISMNNQEGQKVEVYSLSSYKKDISGLSSGVYIVLLEDAEGKVYSEKVLKK